MGLLTVDDIMGAYNRGLAQKCEQDRVDGAWAEAIIRNSLAQHLEVYNFNRLRVPSTKLESGKK